MSEYTTLPEVIRVIGSNDIGEINKCSRITVYTIVQGNMLPDGISVHTENHVYEILTEIKERDED